MVENPSNYVSEIPITKAEKKAAKRAARMRQSTVDTSRFGMSGQVSVAGLLEFKSRERQLDLDETAAETHVFMDSFRPLIEEGTQPDAVVIALKAGLPIGLMMKDLWNDYYPDTPRPAIRYIDIGTVKRGSWGLDGNGMSDVRTFTIEKSEANTYDPEQVRRTYVKKVYSDIDPNQYFTFPYQRIMCVDDFSQTGSTIEAMEETFTTAFPESEVTARVVYSRIPPWYGNVNSDIDILGIQDWDEDSY